MLNYLVFSRVRILGKAIYIWLALLAALYTFPAQALAVTCLDLDGASVYSQESTPVYLGFFGSQFASESIMNQFGTYGSQFNSLSVRNTLGTYGSTFGTYSANNDYTSVPPRIYKYGVLIARLTTNSSISGGVSLSAIDASCTFYSSSPSTGSPPPAPPAPPSWINASDGLYTDKIQLSWATVSGATGYKVYYAESLAGTKFFISSTTGTSMDLIGTAPDTLYYFWVSASNSSGEGALSNSDSGYMAAATQYTLTVNKTGTGLITSTPVGIDCGTNCTGNFAIATNVTLTATPIGGHVFIGWSGEGCTGTEECVLTMDGDKEISAVFQSNFPWTMFLPAITGRGVK